MRELVTMFMSPDCPEYLRQSIFGFFCFSVGLIALGALVVVFSLKAIRRFRLRKVTVI